MAAGVLPKPGTKYGPCLAGCEHRDCAQTRADADTPCHWCSLPIGYGVGHYRTDAGPTHAECEERAAEAGQ